MIVLGIAGLGGCQTLDVYEGTALASCGGLDLEVVSDVDRMPEPVGGVRAIQQRIEVPREGRRVASPADRYSAVTAVVDTTGAVVCTDAVASTRRKGEAARVAVHQSRFVPAQKGGQSVVAAVELRLDVRGRSVRRVVTGDQIQR